MRRVAVYSSVVSVVVGVLVWALFWSGCSSDDSQAQTQNPRLAKSGQQLVAQEAEPVESGTETQTTPVTATVDDARQVAATQAGEVPVPSRDQVAQLMTQARAGNPVAQLELGNILFEGRGVPENAEAARTWWKEAAARGNAAARWNLQMMESNPDEEVSFFGTPSKGRRFVFVIDRSGSMLVDNKFNRAKMELIKTLRTLPFDAKFMIYFFDEDAEALPARDLVQATPANIKWAEQWIRNRGVGGGTDPRQALKFTFNLKPDTVWLLTDGQFADESGALELIRRSNGTRKARINTLAFRTRLGEELLKQIAEENDGNYRFVQN